VRRLLRRCERRLDGVPIPHPFDLDKLCQGVADMRGRPLRRLGIPGLSSTAPCGLWVSVPAADYILFDPNTSRLHAEHIVLHEVGHMLCGHSLTLDVANSTMSRLLPDLDPRTVSLVLGRVSYTTAQEQEAELLASLIRARAAREVPVAAGGADSRRAALRRLSDVLSFKPDPP
jgi:hypothetical protein